MAVPEMRPKFVFVKSLMGKPYCTWLKLDENDRAVAAPKLGGESGTIYNETLAGSTRR